MIVETIFSLSCLMELTETGHMSLAFMSRRENNPIGITVTLLGREQTVI